MNATEDPQTAMLQAMLAGGEGAPTMEEMINQVAESNPAAAAVLQYMAQQRAAEAADAGEAEEEPDDSLVIEASYRHVDEEQAHRTAHALQVLRQRVESLYIELQDLRARNRELAAALGACSRCWGRDSGCPVCEGDGEPGGAPVEPYLYRRLIAPAVRRTNYWDPAEGFGSRAVPHVSESGRPQRTGVETR
jgi:hypothetical protein